MMVSRNTDNQTGAGRFAFYGRCSTEDQQEPAASRAWQLARASATVGSHGSIVAEFFDIGYSRSLPWTRRPEAAALLAEIRSGSRRFDAVVIGEPQRAFYDAQFANTFPVLTHYGVTLWVPDVGGEIDPASEIQDLMMTLFGGMAKGERARIKLRVRTTMGELARLSGRFLGGRTPYGYELADNGPHPHERKAKEGQRLHRLVADATTAGVVVRIFEEFNAGRGLRSIAAGLDADGIACPSATNPDQNPGRRTTYWHHATVRAILENRRYTGFEQWGKTRKTEILLDPDDVTAGYLTRQRRVSPEMHVISAALTHEPIVSTESWEAAAQRLGAAAPAPTRDRSSRAGSRQYVLAGRVRCAICDRKMSGSWNNNRAHYRCRGRHRPPAEQHPATVYIAEQTMIPALDRWIARVFSPENLDTTVALLAAAVAEPTLAQSSRRAAAERRIKAADDALRNFERLAASGADPELIVEWTTKALADRRSAQSDLVSCGGADVVSSDDIRALVEHLGDVPSVLAAADRQKKAALYAALNVTVVYDARTRSAEAEAGVRTVARAADQSSSAHVPNQRVRGGN